MKLLSDILKTLIENLTIEDLPINILIKDQLYDIKTFKYEPKIGEYILELTEGYTYTQTNPQKNTKENQEKMKKTQKNMK